jgi:hypothetical protein
MPQDMAGGSLASIQILLGRPQMAGICARGTGRTGQIRSAQQQALLSRACSRPTTSLIGLSCK